MALTQRQQRGLDKLIKTVKQTFKMSKKDESSQYKSLKLTIEPFKEDGDGLQVLEIFLPDYVEEKGDMKSIIIGVNDKGEYSFGVRNRYGNGFRPIPYRALQNLFWGDDPKTDTTALKNLKIMRETNGVVEVQPLTEEAKERNWNEK